MEVSVVTSLSALFPPLCKTSLVLISYCRIVKSKPDSHLAPLFLNTSKRSSWATRSAPQEAMQNDWERDGKLFGFGMLCVIVMTRGIRRIDEKSRDGSIRALRIASSRTLRKSHSCPWWRATLSSRPMLVKTYGTLLKMEVNAWTTPEYSSIFTVFSKAILKFY